MYGGTTLKAVLPKRFVVILNAPWPGRCSWHGSHRRNVRCTLRFRFLVWEEVGNPAQIISGVRSPLGLHFGPVNDSWDWAWNERGEGRRPRAILVIRNLSYFSVAAHAHRHTHTHIHTPTTVGRALTSAPPAHIHTHTHTNHGRPCFN